MRNKSFYRLQCLLLALILLFLLPTASIAEKIFGGLTFIGDRQGVCIEIAGECATEDIDFELATCGADSTEKEKFTKRMPFTILVPKGTHSLVVKKNGKPIATDQITITPEKVLVYQLP